jgi:hypothetical protein
MNVAARNDVIACGNARYEKRIWHLAGKQGLPVRKAQRMITEFGGDEAEGMKDHWPPKCMEAGRRKR